MSGKLRIPHCLGPPSRNGYQVHRSKVGVIVASCIGDHLARGKVKSVEHALSWSLDSKQLPFTFTFYLNKVRATFNVIKLGQYTMRQSAGNAMNGDIMREDLYPTMTLIKWKYFTYNNIMVYILMKDHIGHIGNVFALDISHFHSSNSKSIRA